MPRITDSALSVLSSMPKVSASSAEVRIFTMAMANAPPNSSNTIETVVEVGRPSELNTSSMITSVTITAMHMHITS